tara:strand:- start:149 stop:865 length:717 start_codon:yes stop_codon:yes gene_type:complete
METMKDVSRTAWENFIRCKRCFYLERKLKIKPVGMPGFPINSRVDTLLKNEFDIYRKKQEPHPIFKKYNLNFVPYKMDEQKLKDFRNNFKGVRAKSIKTNFTIYGSIDDIWLNKDTNEVVILDYKATSTKEKINYVTSSKSYHKSYLRQLDFYAYLLKLNKFKVFKTGYWILCNARNENQKTFGDKLNFNIDLLSYEVNTNYIEDSLVELEKCYSSDKIPQSNPYCDTCRWHKETSKF